MEKNLEKIETQRWEAVNTDAGVTALRAAKSILEPVVTTSSTLLEAVKTIAETIVNFLYTISDPEIAALKAAIAAVREVLEELEGAGGGVFILPVPPRNIDQDYRNIINSTDLANIYESAIKLGVQGGGGNLGFLNTVEQSLTDFRDSARPQLDEDAYIAAAVILMGSDNPLRIIGLLRRLAVLFRGPTRRSSIGEALTTLPPEFPTLKELQVELIPNIETQLIEASEAIYSPEELKSPYAVKLSWKADDEIHVMSWPNSANTGRDILKIENVVIYRSLDKPIPVTASSKQLSQYIYKTIPFSEWHPVFYDNGIELEHTYYYAVGYLLSHRDADNPGEYTDLESVPTHLETVSLDVPGDPRVFTRKGIPPDWISMRSPLRAIPAFARLIDEINAFLDKLEKTLDDTQDKMRRYVEALEREINRMHEWLEEILFTIEELVEALDWEGVYSGVLGIKGKGGNEFLIQSLAQALFDTNDNSRPPFDKGTEFVTGMIFMAGAETPGKLEVIWNQLNLLFGVTVQTGISAVEKTGSAIKTAWDSLEEASSEIKDAITLTENLEEDLSQKEKTSEYNAIGNDLSPAKEDKA